MRIIIVGGGNIGTQFAVHSAEKGYEVIVYTSTPDAFEERYLTIVDGCGIVTHQGAIQLATNDPKEAFQNADVIVVTVPAAIMQPIADLVYKYADSNTIIGVVPGNGGSECAFRQCIERGNVFFGIERVPAIARLVKKGKSVKSIGYRKELHVASLPYTNAKKCSTLVEHIFDIRCIPIPSYLNLTMTPSNPVLHTSRLRVLFGDWHQGIVYNRIPLFYEDWDNQSSELMLACDEEVQMICHALPEFDLQYVKSLKIHYESPSVEAMTKKIASIPAFRGLESPAVKAEGGWIPDLHSRYFTADFSYGLSIIKQIACFAGVRTPNIEETLSWYHNIAIEKREFSFSDYGIMDKTDFKEFYLM